MKDYSKVLTENAKRFLGEEIDEEGDISEEIVKEIILDSLDWLIENGVAKYERMNPEVEEHKEILQSELEKAIVSLKIIIKEQDIF